MADSAPPPQMGFDTKFGDATLKMRSMHGTESLGRLFEYQIDLVSVEGDPLKAKDVLHKNVTAWVATSKDTKRYFNGHVSRLAYTGMDKNKMDGKPMYGYRLTVVPWLWMLTRSAHSRIYQNMKVLDILSEIFQAHGFPNFKPELTADYRKWEYCVQYRETDFNFVSRLMENEGIYYYFAHESGKHTLHLCDAVTVHKKVTDSETLKFGQPPLQADDDRYVWNWTQGNEVLSKVCGLTDFNPLKSQTDMVQRASIQNTEDTSVFNQYDYPGGYTTPDEGHFYIGVRTEEIESQYSVGYAACAARSVFPGALFKLDDHPVIPAVDYLITGATYQLQNDDTAMGSGGSGGGASLFSSSITVHPASMPYRSERLTPKPVIQGVQTAYVVGEDGQDMTTDQYGRIKVKFHWDKKPERNETSSCYVRVAQNWAAKKWGFHFIPRIGMEVIVTFLEGDPDRPLVTGCVYNDVNLPPYDLPKNKTQSGVKSRSTLQGTSDNFNELRFEDKKGSELFYFQAEKDMTTLVKNDRSATVQGNDKITVSGSKGREMFIDQGARYTHVGFKEGDGDHGMGQYNIAGNDLLIVKNDKWVNILGNSTLNTSGNYGMIIKGDQGMKADVRAGDYAVDIADGDHTVTLGQGNQSVEIKMGDRETKIDKGNDALTLSMGDQSTKLDLGASSTEAMKSIQFKVGQNSITIDQKGITISGMMISIQGQVQTEIKGLMVSVKGSAMLQAQGAITMIG